MKYKFHLIVLTLLAVVILMASCTPRRTSVRLELIVSPTRTSTFTPSATSTGTSTPSQTPTSTATWTPSPTFTNTATFTPANTLTPSLTPSNTPTPTATATQDVVIETRDNHAFRINAIKEVKQTNRILPQNDSIIIFEFSIYNNSSSEECYSDIEFPAYVEAQEVNHNLSFG